MSTRRALPALLAAAALAAAPAQAGRLFTNSSVNRLVSTSTPITGFPYTIGSWVSTASIAVSANEAILVEGGTNAAHSFARVYVNYSGGSDPQNVTGESVNNGGPTGEFNAGASWLVNATSVTVPSGLAWIVNGMRLFDATVGLTIGTVTGYSGTTLSITAAAHASSGASDLVAIGTIPNLNAYVQDTVTGASSFSSSYLYGLLNGTNSSAVAFPANITETDAGVQRNNTYQFPYDGIIGPQCVWNQVLTQAEAVVLRAATPYDPRCEFVRPSALVAEWLMDGDGALVEQDHSGLNNAPMVVTGTVKLAGGRAVGPVFAPGQTALSRAYLSPAIIGKRPMNLALPLVGPQ